MYVQYIQYIQYINGKIKQKERITRLKENNETVEDPKEMSEILNKNFQNVLTSKTEFRHTQKRKESTELLEIKVSRHKIKELLKNLKERKAIGPDGVSGHVLKECREQLIKPICDIIESSVKQGKVPNEWKRAEIIPIYNSSNKEL